MGKIKRGKGAMAAAMENAVEAKEIQETEAAAAAGQEVPLKNYKLKFSYVTEEGKRVDQSQIVTDCKNMHEAKNVIFNKIASAGLNGEALTYDEITEVSAAEVAEAEPPKVDPQRAMFKMDDGNNEADACEGPRKTSFIARIANVGVKNGTVRLLKIVMECAVDVPHVNSELLLKFRSNEDLFITVEPHQMTTKDVHPTKKFKEKVEEGEAESTAAPTPIETEEYICPFCSTINHVDKNNRPVEITCTHCGNVFPIEFKDGEQPAATEEAQPEQQGEERDPDACVRCGDIVGRDNLNGNLYCDKCWKEIHTTDAAPAQK